ncbi:uncharacterized protein LOC110991530 [Pieris rapae]|uniref:uncharacterized protein LOC110991530 n=1 Tax=Pieris rapae TaxID=64459 RepID=UPI001E27A790|nr:uncharacterized protein LOC110991530 [Pieris rapae]
MRTFIVFALFAVVAVSARPDVTYTDKYDSVNLDEILNNERLLIPYIKCILEQGKCSPDGKELKAHIREALVSNCAKCTDTQKSGTRRVIGHLINKQAAYWEQLKAKYDPDHKFVLKYEKELRTVAAQSKMKTTCVCLFAIIALAVAEKYTDRYDNINLDEILANRRLLVPYMKCVLDEGKCSADGKELKVHLTEALHNDCQKCTENQKKGSGRVLSHLINKEAEFWQKLKAKYDPENNYAPKYEKDYKQ